MNRAEQAFLTSFRQAVGSPTANWVEWVHVSKGKTHCETCLTLDKCWFMAQTKPILPQHFFCHCTTEPLPYSRVMQEATSASAYSKFDPYLFDPENVYEHKKGDMFRSWGYSIEDSQWLKEEIEKQGLEKYTAGEYTLGRLNDNGQRISIRIELPRKNQAETVSFITGWMVYPNGHIQLNTPYGGK